MFVLYLFCIFFQIFFTVNAKSSNETTIYSQDDIINMQVI